MNKSFESSKKVSTAKGFLGFKDKEHPILNKKRLKKYIDMTIKTLLK